MTATERIIGLDVSLTGTGVAVLYRDGTAMTDTIVTKGKREDTIRERDQRIDYIADRVSEWLSGRPALVVVEGPAGARPGGSTWDRAGLWWRLVDMALNRAPVGIVAPTARAKWATGRGNADKAAVAAAMARAYPDVELSTSDEADALVLAAMGAQRLGWNEALTKADRLLVAGMQCEIEVPW